MGASTAVPGQSRSVAPIAPLAVTGVVAAVTFLLAYDGGSFGLTSRGTLSIAVWWVLILAVAAGVWPLRNLDWTTLAVGGLLVAFAGLTLASVIWSDDPEVSFDEFNRAALYVGIFAVAALGARRSFIPRWCDGFALGIAAVAVLAFLSRCFPDLIAGENLQGLPLDLTRLSYPLGYWNGLAIFVALSVPLLLRLAVSAAPLVLRALALAPFPVLGAVLYLTSSRGGIVTAALGALASRPRPADADDRGDPARGRGRRRRHRLHREPRPPRQPSRAGGRRRGHVAFPLVFGVCVVTGVVAFLVFRFVAVPLERRTARVGRVARIVAVGLVVALVAAGVAAAHPVRLFEHFKAVPAYTLNTLPKDTQNPVQGHLLSVGSSGRWQQWASAVKEFRSAPALGKGAGSYEEWWARYGTLKGFVKDAHSLYLESLGELGIVGFVFIAGAFLIGLVAGLRRVLARAGEERLALAAVWAAFLAYAFAAGVDWMWEMTVVSVVGIALLGLLVSRASGVTDASEKPLRLRWDVAGRVALVVAGVCVILAAALPLLTNREIQASQAAVRAGDLGAAFKRADNARKIEPWATSPYQQLALVSEQAQEYGDAQYWARKAIEHAPNDWQPWFLLTRFRAENGQITAAVITLQHTRELSPRSELLARVKLGQ